MMISAVRWCVLIFAGSTSVAVPSVAQLARWTLTEPSAVSIGGEGDPQTEFLRIGGVAFTDAHEILVANTSSQELRVFDERGQFLRSYGRSGSGPGEFRRMSWVARSNDSLFLYDFGQRRVSVFSARTGFLGSTQLPALSAMEVAYPVGRLANGEFVVLPVKPASAERSEGTYRDSIRVGVVPANPRSVVVWLGTFPYMTHLAVSPSITGRPMPPGIYRFGPGFHVAAAADRVWIGDSGQAELRAFDAAGRMTQIRLPWTPRPFDDAAFNRARRRELDGARDERARVAISAQYDARYRPQTEPFFSRLIPSRSGSLWVERYRTDPGDAADYLVLDRAGKPMAQLSGPPGFTPYEVGDDYVLGVSRDADGVEAVVMYHLGK
jgi:hypothetical protein